MSGGDLFVEQAKTGTALREVFVMDAHCHLGPSRRLTALDTSVEGVLGVMDRLGINFAAVSSIPASADGVIKMGNDQVIDAVRRFPNRFFGFISVNPRYPEAAAKELERCFKAGLRGVKVVYIRGTMYDHISYNQVWDFAAKYNFPVLAHTCGKVGIRQIEPCFTRYPGITWIMAHGGIADPQEYVRVGREYPNVFVDTVCSACQRGMVEYLVRNGLEKKLMWGTDLPWMSAQPQLGKILFAKISPEQKAKVLGLNARRVFGLTEPEEVSS